MKIWNAALVCGVLGVGAVVGAHPAQAQGTQFPDVPANHWAYQAVQDLADKGYVKGYPDGRFLGKRDLTRYEFATVIDRIVQTVSDLNAKVMTTPTGVPVTQDDLNKIQVLVDGFKTQLDAIGSQVSGLQDQIDSLRQDVLDAKAIGNKAQATANAAYSSNPKSKFVITGYIQARFQDADSGSRTAFPQGVFNAAGAYNGSYATGSNPLSFDVRRARLRFLGALTDQTHYALQIDASGAVSAGAAANQQVTTREAWVGYTFGDGTKKNLDGTLTNPTITAGLFANPFGYVLPASASTWITPERPLAFSESGQGIWTNQDYDKGVQLTYFPGPLRLTYALVNGAGRTSDSIARRVDSIARVAYVLPAKTFGLGVGASYYDGQVDDYGSFPGTVAAGTQREPKKQLLGLDAQLTTPVGFFANAEYLKGKYERRAYFNESVAGNLGNFPQYFTSDNYVKNNQIQGYYVWGGYTFNQTGAHPLTLAADYDQLQRSQSAQNDSGNALANGNSYRSNAAYDDVNYGFGGLLGLDKVTRLRLWYTKPNAVAHAPGTPAPQRIGMYTAELQVKF